jgi:DNA-binding NtrC family response regulator
VAQEHVVRDQLEKLVTDMVARGVLFEDAVRAFERAYVAHVLARADGNVTRAADALGIHRNTLSRKMSEYRLKRG